MLHEEQAAEQRKQGLMGTLQTLGEQRDKQIKVYQAAHRDHETILSLFNNLRSTYEQEQLRTEQKYLDDIYMARRHRN